MKPSKKKPSTLKLNASSKKSGENLKKFDDQFINIAKMLVSALKELKKPKGCSIIELKQYFKNHYGQLSNEFLSKLSMALKRGVNFGAIKKCNGHYKLDSIMTVAARRPCRRKPKRSKDANKDRNEADNAD